MQSSIIHDSSSSENLYLLCFNFLQVTQLQLEPPILHKNKHELGRPLSNDFLVMVWNIGARRREEVEDFNILLFFFRHIDRLYHLSNLRHIDVNFLYDLFVNESFSDSRFLDLDVLHLGCLVQRWHGGRLYERSRGVDVLVVLYQGQVRSHCVLRYTVVDLEDVVVRF